MGGARNGASPGAPVGDLSDLGGTMFSSSSFSDMLFGSATPGLPGEGMDGMDGMGHLMGSIGGLGDIGDLGGDPIADLGEIGGAPFESPGSSRPQRTRSRFGFGAGEDEAQGTRARSAFGVEGLGGLDGRADRVSAPGEDVTRAGGEEASQVPGMVGMGGMVGMSTTRGSAPVFESLEGPSGEDRRAPDQPSMDDLRRELQHLQARVQRDGAKVWASSSCPALSWSFRSLLTLPAASKPRPHTLTPFGMRMTYGETACA